jgi:DNA-binding XRE family transcriptional regulator
VDYVDLFCGNLPAVPFQRDFRPGKLESGINIPLTVYHFEAILQSGKEIMATKWGDVRGTHSPEVEERIRRSVEEAAIVMRLYQLREARNLTQVNLAKVLEINQGAVSRVEKRRDMYVSTLRSYIEAMGGQLQIKAIFPEGEVEIDQFETLAESEPDSTIPRRGVPL